MERRLARVEQALGGPCPYPGAAAATDGQAQRIQQDGFARPGLARQDIQAGREFQRRLFDQDDVANGQG